jgi:hypothetical protein
MTTAHAANNRLSGMEYRLSLERLTELNRSPIPLLLARLSTSCPSYGKTPADIDDPTPLIAEIRTHCADNPDFVRQSMPLQEIVFRTLLLNGDGPMTLGELHRELTERWSSPLRPITVTLSGLARILDSDDFYGFESIPMAELEPELADLPMLNSPAADDPEDLAQLAAAIASHLDGDDNDDGSDLFDEEDDEEDDLDLFEDDGDEEL